MEGAKKGLVLLFTYLASRAEKSPHSIGPAPPRRPSYQTNKGIIGMKCNSYLADITKIFY